ncbi:MAG: hypothetical protein JO199_04660 [Candidatus Eremiobacteraeota bacterium]|nr:hypothetical protein [Candidatus Eremiobacteraeota bacterium]
MRDRTEALAVPVCATADIIGDRVEFALIWGGTAEDLLIETSGDASAA